MKYLVAFIGFGEAAFHIASGLKSEGLDSMIAYDIMQDDPVRGDIVRKRAQSAGIELAPTSQDAHKNAEIVISLTSASVAVNVAKSILPDLVAGQVFADLNSAAPQVEQEIDALPRAEGVLFADVGVLGNVPAAKHKVKCFVCGSGGKKFYDLLMKYNMNLILLDKPAGAASAIKMFRSIFAKGFPQMLMESLISAKYYGVLDYVIGTYNNSFVNRSMEDYANAILCRTMIHAKRQAAEVGCVVETIEDLGLDASFSKGTYKKFLQMADMNLVDEIGPDADLNYIDSVDLYLKKVKG